MSTTSCAVTPSRLAMSCTWLGRRSPSSSADLHERPRAQDVFLDGCLDPPHRIGGEAEALVRLEALDRLHEPDIALRDHLGDRQAVAAIADGDLGNQPQMAGHEALRRIEVAVLAPAFGQHVFLVRF
jgi:hypothetical protein